ncbi:MAG TPA: RnfH family protein [Casimicrobiaceae bacterium]|nr:RnfH family protein [Casimicrobiaceae bacterium]
MIPAAPGIEVTVVFALPDRATQLALRLPAGATVADALERSGLAARHPELDLAGARVGIFGKLADRKAILADGDRVEVYRALVADSKERRLRRVAADSKTHPT